MNEKSFDIFNSLATLSRPRHQETEVMVSPAYTHFIFNIKIHKKYPGNYIEFFFYLTLSHYIYWK